MSVIVRCYQQAEYLGEAVASVVRQTFDDWEIVIVDDGSPDETAEVAGALIAAHPNRRIRLLRQANKGLSTALNNGIAASSGRYILPLDADDLIMPEMLQKTVALLDAEPSVSIAYVDQQHFGLAPKVVRTPGWDPDLLRRRNLFAYCSLFRRDVWNRVGGYNPNMRWGYEDWDFWVGAAAQGFVGRRIPEVLFAYRVRASGMHAGARLRHRELVAQIRANHQDWYRHTWRRWRYWPARAWRHLRHLARRASGRAG